VEKYVTKLAEIFNLQKEDETACVAELVDILDGNVFWYKGKEAQKSEIKESTRFALRSFLKPK
jgi:hypothetical protein